MQLIIALTFFSYHQRFSTNTRLQHQPFPLLLSITPIAQIFHLQFLYIRAITLQHFHQRIAIRIVTVKLKRLVLMNFFYVVKVFSRFRDYHGYPFGISPESIILVSYICELLSWIFSVFDGIVSIIEDIELVSAEITSKLSDKGIVLLRLLILRNEIIAANIHGLFLSGQQKSLIRMIIQFINGILLLLIRLLHYSKVRV